jgi:2-dehydro-3-deoxygluconokinase
MYDILGIGEALIEFAEVQPSIYKQSFAGDVINTLFYSSRLGLRTSFFSSFGKDIYTNDLLKFFENVGIDYSACQVLQSKNNGLYIIRTAKNGEPEFTFFRENSAARDTLLHSDQKKISSKIEESKVVLFSGIVLAVFHDIESFVQLLSKKRRGTIVYFDVNVRLSLWKDVAILRDWIRRLAGLVDIISLSVSDDEKIFGTRSKKEILDWYLGKGYSKIILRDGVNDVVLHFDGKQHEVPVNVVSNIIDTTGAGDAFNAAFMYGFLSGKSPDESALLGNKAASQVLGYNGGIVQEFDPAKVTTLK